ncbi:hypothetical protein [Psychromonas aquatilis]|uniref:Sulfotransferase family protein n=1 Tax=Psychromonas aquatilis TaxID=2005072 RepID=A0ABU9GTW5_9GAMM
MMRKLILHVGAHKTGTSTIQKNLSLIPELEWDSAGCTYPIFNNGFSDIFNHSIVIYSFFSEHADKYHMNLKFGFDNQSKVNALNEKYLQQMDTFFNKSKDTIILSGEDIGVLSENELKELKLFFISRYAVTDFQVVYSVREHLSYLNSDLQEAVKGGQTLKALTQLKVSTVENIYQNTISKFLDVFGGASLNIYSFELAIKEKAGLTKFFINNFIPELHLCDFEEVKSNESLSYEATELISYINEKLSFYVDGVISKEREVNDLIPLWKIKGEKFTINCEADLFEEDKKWLLKNFNINYLIDVHPNKDLNKNYWSIESLNDLESAMAILPEKILNLIIEFLKVKAFGSSDPNKSILFLQLAKKYRPNGPLINERLNHYKRSV